ncbi:MAG: ribonuclease HIII [Candidatus Dojkabacteria bacterium]|nr:ribonuclease HIII [Candidatus Dojkabacteria bacterium]
MIQNTVSIQLDKHQTCNVEKILTSFGWYKEDINNPYAVIRMKSPEGSVAILYSSNKLVFQGVEDYTQVISALKSSDEKEIEIVPHIGVDEVGKGDYFGPLVVVGCFLDKELYKKASSIGVGDSKRFSDNRIIQMYDLLKDYPYYYVSIVTPSDYNDIYSKVKNVSILLAREHARVIEMGLKNLKSKNIECNTVVIDQFSTKKSRVLNELGELGKKVDFQQYHKGESDMGVAVASVLARGIFIQEMDDLSKKYKFNFPKGASDVIDRAQEFVRKNSVEELSKVAKISFKTTAKVLQTRI